MVLAQEKKAVVLTREKVVGLAQEKKAVDPRAQKAAHAAMLFVEAVRF